LAAIYFGQFVLLSELGLEGFKSTICKINLSFNLFLNKLAKLFLNLKGAIDKLFR
jgi:hypothetical protein